MRVFYYVIMRMRRRIVQASRIVYSQSAALLQDEHIYSVRKGAVAVLCGSIASSSSDLAPPKNSWSRKWSNSTIKYYIVQSL